MRTNRDHIITSCILHLLFHFTVISASQDVCLDWVDTWWQFMVLGENRPARMEDFLRVFTLMDSNVDGTVSESEFRPVWEGCTRMSAQDSQELFKQISMSGETSRPDVITNDNVRSCFNYFDTDNKDQVSKTDFIYKMEMEILPNVPQKGCPTDRLIRSLYGMCGPVAK